MRTSEKKILAKLLNAAADEYANHGCNDHELDNTQENIDMLNELEQWNVGPGREPEEVHVFDPSQKHLIVMDFSLLRFFAHKVLEGKD